MATRGQRAGTACDECRRRKLRCDGQQPQCSICLGMGIACEVTQRGVRGPKKGYLTALKNRVVQLEALLDSRRGGQQQQQQEEQQHVDVMNNNDDGGFMIPTPPEFSTVSVLSAPPALPTRVSTTPVLSIARGDEAAQPAAFDLCRVESSPVTSCALQHILLPESSLVQDSGSWSGRSSRPVPLPSVGRTSLHITKNVQAEL